MVLTLLCAPHSGANHATATVVFVSLKRRCCSSRQNWIGCTTIWNKNGLELFKIVRARYGQLVHPLFSVAGSIRNLSRSSQKISGKPHLTKQIINRNRKLPTVVVKLLLLYPNTDYYTQKNGIIGTNSLGSSETRVNCWCYWRLQSRINCSAPKIRETLIILEDPQGIFLICFKAVFAGKKAEKIKIYVALIFLSFTLEIPLLVSLRGLYCVKIFLENR